MSALSPGKSALSAVAVHSMPSTASLRRLLKLVFVLDADLDAFCLDFFPAVHAEFTQGMIRTAKVNLLLSLAPADSIFAKLNEHYPDAVAECLKDGLSPSSKGMAYRAPSMLDSRERLNRQRMIERVRKFWIEGVLEKSLHGAMMMELGKEYRPDAVAYPWEMVMERPDTSPQLIPKGRRMIELFDENLGELLILGGPGSGKTTMLLDLCRDLLKRGQEDEAAPIPVVFKLSSWSQKRQPLLEWMKESLQLHYQISTKLASTWIDSAAIIPLLDGLDEMRHEHRALCIESINDCLSKHTLLGIAVASRENEYTVAKTHLNFTSAIHLQPLTVQQVAQHLTTLGNCSQEEIASITTNQHASEVLSIPLFLMVLLEVLNGKAHNVITATLGFDPSAELLSAHVKKATRLLHHQAGRSLEYLRWLARYFQASDEPIFYVEKMQPSLLDSLSTQRLYTRVNTVCHGILFAIAMKFSFATDGSWITCLIISLITLHLMADEYSKRIRLIEKWQWSWENLKTQGEAVIIELSRRTRPNQGTMNSLRMAIIVFFIQVTYWPIMLPLLYKKYHHGRAFEIGLSIGIFAGLGFGGSPVISHFLLRSLLIRQKYQPWKYVAFLEQCVKAKLLARVGGGYIFIHRFLMEYFASLTDEDIKRLAAEATPRK